MKLAMTVLFVLSAGWMNFQTADYFIDLSTLEGSTDEEILTVPIADRVGATPRVPVPLMVHGSDNVPVVPFELIGLSFDRSDYNLGDPFTYEVTLRYLGSAEFKFPIAWKKHLFRDGMSGLRYATVSLEIEDSFWKHHVFRLTPLYGSDEVPGSLLTVTANPTIRLRDEGRWQMKLGSPPAPPMWTGHVMPFAVLQLEHNHVSYRPGRSAPTVAIQLTKR